MQTGTKVGLVGWRGMVGSVLLERMRQEGDFKGIEPRFFSSGCQGQPAPSFEGIDTSPPLADPYDWEVLGEQEVILCCQGSAYTKQAHSRLCSEGWRGYWIDSSSALRMEEASQLALDPVNGDSLKRALDSGSRLFVGPNCVISLLLMGLAGLLKRGWVEWITTMTYQAASGAGAVAMRELVAQMRAIGNFAFPSLNDPSSSALTIDQAVEEAYREDSFPQGHFGVPLAGSAIPWIDSPLPGGMTREEWKSQVEAQKILKDCPTAPLIDGTCVRVGVLRSHSQALTMKLKESLSLREIEDTLSSAHPWVRVVPNDEVSTRTFLTPRAVTGSLEIAVGRIRKLGIGANYLTAFVVGDQLLWGAAEPVRRVLGLVLAHINKKKTKS